MANTASSSRERDGRDSATAKTGSDESGLDPDEMFHILQTRRRRDVLRYLRSADDPVDLRELAERIAAWEHDTTVENLHSDQRQRVYISLYQSHLPKLDNRGIVSYDKDRGIVAATPLLSQFEPYLTGLEGSSDADPWPRRYAGTAGCYGLVLAAIAVGIVPLSWAGAAVLAFLAFASVAALHAYSESTHAVDDLT